MDIFSEDLQLVNQLPNVMKTCSDCHGEDKQKGGVDFRDFKINKLTEHDLEIISESIELIQEGEMPPPKKKTLTLEEKGDLS